MYSSHTRVDSRLSLGVGVGRKKLCALSPLRPGYRAHIVETLGYDALSRYLSLILKYSDTKRDKEKQTNKQKSIKF